MYDGRTGVRHASRSSRCMREFRHEEAEGETTEIQAAGSWFCLPFLDILSIRYRQRMSHSGMAHSQCLFPSLPARITHSSSPLGSQQMHQARVSMAHPTRVID